jgi:DNA-directed RNA polymerase sigma subunit (sigma70/sigma32)
MIRRDLGRRIRRRSRRCPPASGRIIRPASVSEKISRNADEISRRFALSRERIRQIEMAVMRKMRAAR